MIESPLFTMDISWLCGAHLHAARAFYYYSFFFKLNWPGVDWYCFKPHHIVTFYTAKLSLDGTVVIFEVHQLGLVSAFFSM